MKRRDQYGHLKGFDEVFVRAGFECSLAVAMESAARGDNNAGGSKLRVSAQSAADLETVATRHQKVADHDAGPVRARQLQPVLTIVGIPHLPAIRPQQLRDEYTVI